MGWLWTMLEYSMMLGEQARMALYRYEQEANMASERFGREGLKAAMVAEMRRNGRGVNAEATEAEDKMDRAYPCAAYAALDYLDRFTIALSGVREDMVLIRPKPATNPALDAAKARVAEAQASLASAQSELDRASKEGR